MKKLLTLALGLLLLNEGAFAESTTSYRLTTCANGIGPCVVPVTPMQPLPVAGASTTLSATPTVTSGSAYSSGQWIGGLITLSGATRSYGASGLVQSVVITDASKQAASLDIVFFNANPSSTTISDKTTADIAAADYGKVMGVVHLTDWSTFNTVSVGQGQQQALPFKLSTSTTLYAAMVSRGTPTYTSTSALGLQFQILQDQ